MLPIQKIEELISISYVSAVVARAGFSPNPVAHDFGIDLGVHKIAVRDSGKRVDLGSILNLQLKASINWAIDKDNILFDMEADAYNKLIYSKENSSIPSALVLCCLSKNTHEWIKVREEELIMKKCCYYYFVQGSETKNNSSKRIRIPRNQLLTPESISELKDKFYEGAIE
jgi:hypothetical protein